MTFSTAEPICSFSNCAKIRCAVPRSLTLIASAAEPRIASIALPNSGFTASPA
jgi:hypothetical protein